MALDGIAFPIFSGPMVNRSVDGCLAGDGADVVAIALKMPQKTSEHAGQRFGIFPNNLFTPDIQGTIEVDV